ncbi:MAG: hypothetical protein ABSB57_05475 [Dehalococcoidia bacterium]
MKRLLVGAALAGAIAVAVVLVGVGVLRSQGSGSGVSAGEGEYGTLYIDVKPDASNTTTGFGPIDVCRDTDDLGGSLDVGDSFTVDVVIGGAVDLAGPYWILYYNKDVLKVTGYNWTSWKMGAGGLNFTDAVPDSDGAFSSTYAQSTGVNGDGVLQRLTLQAIANGSSDLKLCTVEGDCPDAADSAGKDHFYPEVLVDDPAGQVRAVVGGSCPPVTPAAIEPTRAAPEPTPTPVGLAALPSVVAEQERLRLDEAAKPTFEGVVNGIRLYPTDAQPAVQRKSACTDAKPEEVEQLTMSAVAGTPMEIMPSYLPAGAEEVPAMWPPVACKGTVANVERQWIIRGEGFFIISRRQGEQAIDIDASAGRVSPATIAGKPAVLVEPLTPEGYGYSMVIVAEDFGLTVIGADGLPLRPWWQA